MNTIIPEHANQTTTCELKNIPPDELGKLTKEIVNKVKLNELNRDDALKEEKYFLLFERYPDLFNMLFDKDRFREEDFLKFLECITNNNKNNTKQGEEMFESYLYEKYGEKADTTSNSKTHTSTNQLKDKDNNNSPTNVDERLEKFLGSFDKKIFDDLISNAVIGDEQYHKDLEPIFLKCYRDNIKLPICNMKDIFLKYDEFFKEYLKMGFFAGNGAFIMKSNISMMGDITSMSPNDFEKCCENFPNFRNLIYANRLIYNFKMQNESGQPLVKIFILHAYIYNNHPSYDQMFQKLQNVKSKNQEDDLLKEERNIVTRLIKIFVFETIYNAEFFDSDKQLGEYLMQQV